MYEELVSFLRHAADTDFSDAPAMRFKRRLLRLLQARSEAFTHCNRSTLEAIVASMAVELPATLQDERVHELVGLYARVIERLYEATVRVGYTDVDAAFRRQARQMSLKLSD